MTALTKIDSIFFKREDQNPTGSVKDRSLPVQIKNLKKLKFNSAVISSSGNAALSALYYCPKNNILLTIFVSPKIAKKKLKLLKEKSPRVFIDSKPISSAFKFAQKNQAYLLRQSTDPAALLGYKKLGLELKKQLPSITSLFLPVGSGTTLLGISKALPKIKLFAIQPASHAPIASVFDQGFTLETKTITDALSVKSLPLKQKVIAAIKKSAGTGLVVQNQAVKKNLQKLSSFNFSAETALGLAGLQKCQQQRIDFGPHPVILVTGKKR